MTAAIRRFFVLALALAFPFAAFAAGQSNPLLQASDITWIGAFRAPTGTYNGTSLQYGGYGLSLFNDPLHGKTLWIEANAATSQGMVAQITIPGTSTSSTWSNLPSATVVRGINQIADSHAFSCNNGWHLYGALQNGNNVVWSGTCWYAYNSDQPGTHGVSGHDISISNDFTRWENVGTSYMRRAVSGYMANIPADWQGLLGGNALTGNGSLSLIGETSAGPSAYVFDKTAIGSATTHAATRLLEYGITVATAIDPACPLGDCASALWSLQTFQGGMIVPDGYRTVLYGETHGQDDHYCYGTEACCSGTGSCDGGYGFGFPVCEDGKGPHTSLKRWQFLAYDLNDLLAVKNGTALYHDPAPYAIMTSVYPPYFTGRCHPRMLGMAYDPDTRRLYISYDFGTEPTIQVFEIAAASSSTYTVTPSAGPNGSISPNTAQTVASGATMQFTVTPNSGYTASVGGTCGGSLAGTTYTTAAVAADCTVSATFADTEAPTVPGYLDAYGSSTTSVTLKWEPSTDNAGVALYRVDYCAGYNCSNWALLGTTAATTIDHTGIAASSDPQIYRYRIRAEDAAGNPSAYALSIRYNAAPTVPAFPGAQGSGAMSKGGRGGTVYRVTSLANSGAGTLRECVLATGPRTCVFSVGGTIDLTSSLVASGPYITIAGHTAPGGGITLAGTGFYGDLFGVQTHNVIVRNVRFRHGYNAGQTYNNGDSINVMSLNNVPGSVNRVIFDHVTSSWGLDENFGIWSNTPISVRDVTISNSMLYEPLGPDFLNTLIGAGTSVRADAMVGIDIFRTLFAQASYRNPLVKVKQSRLVNDLFYNWRYSATALVGGVYADIIGNHYKGGPLRGGRVPYEVFVAPTSVAGTPTGSPSVFTSGNKGYSNPDPANDDWGMMWEVAGEGSVDEWTTPGVNPIGVLPLQYRRMTPLPSPMWPISAIPETDLEASLLPVVGASRRLDCAGNWTGMRDSQDARIVSEYESGTGSASLPANETAVGGYPTLAAGTACTDTDGDGMPDTWETAQGLNPSSAADGPTLHASGYSHLERYLAGAGDSIAPVLFGFGPASPLPASSTTATLALNTDEPATCRYSTGSGAAWGAMTPFSTTGGTSHGGTVSVARGRTDWYYVRCNDASGNVSAQSVHRLSVSDAPKRRGSR